MLHWYRSAVHKMPLHHHDHHTIVGILNIFVWHEFQFVLHMTFSSESSMTCEEMGSEQAKCSDGVVEDSVEGCKELCERTLKYMGFSYEMHISSGKGRNGKGQCHLTKSTSNKEDCVATTTTTTTSTTTTTKATTSTTTAHDCWYFEQWSTSTKKIALVQKCGSKWPYTTTTTTLLVLWTGENFP